MIILNKTELEKYSPEAIAEIQAVKKFGDELTILIEADDLKNIQEKYNIEKKAVSKNRCGCEKSIRR